MAHTPRDPRDGTRDTDLYYEHIILSHVTRRCPQHPPEGQRQREQPAGNNAHTRLTHPATVPVVSSNTVSPHYKTVSTYALDTLNEMTNPATEPAGATKRALQLARLLTRGQLGALI